VVVDLERLEHRVQPAAARLELEASTSVAPSIPMQPVNTWPRCATDRASPKSDQEHGATMRAGPVAVLPVQPAGTTKASATAASAG
jgi:hypothetical protein